MRRQRRVIAAVAAGHGVKVGIDRIGSGRHPRQRAQYVQADDVSRPLPDGIERRLAVQHRHGGVLDIAHAAHHLHRLVNDVGAQLVAQELGQRHAQPGKGAVLFVRAVKGARHPHTQRQRAFPIQRQIGQHDPHQGLVDQPALERTAVAHPVQRLGQRGAHQTGGRHRGIEAGMVNHLDDGAHASALVPQAVRQRANKLDLGRGVGAVAKLVLQPLDANGVAPRFQPARHHETGQATGGLRQGQEPIRHRRRAEPLVPGQPPAIARAFGPRGVGAHVRSALFFGHRHAHRRGVLFRQRPDRRVIAARGQFRPPLRKKPRIGPQRRHRGIGHRHRAADAGLDLGGQIDHRGMGGVTARRALPGNGGIAPLQPRRHQPVPGGVKRHLVQPPPAGIEQHRLGRVVVGIAASLAHLGAAQHGVIARQMRHIRPGGGGMVAQRRVARPQVGIIARGRLVGHLMGRQVVTGRQLWHERLAPALMLARPTPTGKGGFTNPAVCGRVGTARPKRGGTRGRVQIR